MNGTFSILITTDFSDISRVAFSAARAHAERLGLKNVQFTVVTVLQSMASAAFTESIGTEGDEVQRKLLDQAEKKLDELVRENFPDLPVSTIVLPGLDSAANEIVNYANEKGFELIVIASHGRSGISRFVLGSVAESVLRQSTCPMLIVPVDKIDT